MTSSTIKFKSKILPSVWKQTKTKLWRINCEAVHPFVKTSLSNIGLITTQNNIGYHMSNHDSILSHNLAILQISFIDQLKAVVPANKFSRHCLNGIFLVQSKSDHLVPYLWDINKEKIKAVNTLYGLHNNTISYRKYLFSFTAMNKISASEKILSFIVCKKPTITLYYLVRCHLGKIISNKIKTSLEDLGAATYKLVKTIKTKV